MKKILIPFGGVGNRIRFISSSIDCLKEGDDIIILNFITKMFPGTMSDYFSFPDNVSEVSIRFPNEYVLIAFFRIILFFCSILTFGIITNYGVRSIKKHNMIITSPYHIIGYSWVSCPLKERKVKINTPYNAVHIRRSDNMRALKMNKISTYEDFIENSILPVYVATDDEALKLHLKKKFGCSVLSTDCDLDRGVKENLEAAVDEIWISIMSNEFLGSKGSSFSDLIINFRKNLKEA